ncbi:MAG TPA: cytochrome c-type biogenesis protein [Longimicrobiales bacterium]|nr:cytochrome c-type biogenesis protein [Longimicrobiales bacterium]
MRFASLQVVLLVLLLVLAASPAQIRAAQGQDTPARPVETVQVVEETEIDRQVRELAAKLRCPVCQGLSLQDSPSELAQEMRAVIRARLEAGDTHDEVLEYFVGRYAEWILLEPKAEGFNLAVYVLPILAGLGGAAFLLVAGRRWLAAARPARSQTDAPDEADPDLVAWEDLVQR